MLNFLQITLSLVFVLALIFLAFKLIQRFSHKHLPQRSVLKVLATVAVGTREKVILLEAEGQKLLVGVGPGQVRFLSHLTNSAEPATPEPEQVLPEELDEQTMAMRTPWLQHQLSKLHGS